MRNHNRLELIGFIGSDPERRADNSPATFSVATTEKWKSKNGDLQEHTEWTKIEVWGKQGDFCMDYLKKGSLVRVEGKKRTDRVEDGDGNVKYFTKCVAFDVMDLSQREKSDSDSQPMTGRRRRGSASDFPVNT